MGFPQIRMRRLRKSAFIRDLVSQTHLRPADFIMPLFICPGSGVRLPIQSMPGVFRLSIDTALEECKTIRDAGIKAVLLFGIPDQKDETGEIASLENGIIQQAIKAIKARFPELVIISDVCNCEYTTHGHCGVIKNNTVDNDLTLDILNKQALSHSRCGVDFVAPSDMMDGRVGAIRSHLDHNDFSHVGILSYAAKFASSFYGPFREAADCAPQFGDRKSYQMDPANGDEALREVALDIEEGADIIMIKPALCYLDIIHRVKTTFKVPVAAYNVSGEYAMVKAAAHNGWIKGESIMMELLLSIKRAGADMIITYHAIEAAHILRNEYNC